MPLNDITVVLLCKKYFCYYFDIHKLYSGVPTLYRLRGADCEAFCLLDVILPIMFYFLDIKPAAATYRKGEDNHSL